MTEQEKREKVIEELINAERNFIKYSGDEYEREYEYAHIELSLLRDAIGLLKAQEKAIKDVSSGSYLENIAVVAREMGDSNVTVPLYAYCEMLNCLKAQEPRVMTLEEVQNADYCWLETKGWVDGDAFVPVLRLPNDYNEAEIDFSDAKNCDYGCEIIGYNIGWRCWTSRPTDEQRKAVKWE